MACAIRWLPIDRINCQEAAELFYYLNRMGYNGLCCFNRTGLFNMPYGRHPTIHYTTDFLAYRGVGSLDPAWRSGLTANIAPADSYTGIPHLLLVIQDCPLLEIILPTTPAGKGWPAARRDRSPALRQRVGGMAQRKGGVGATMIWYGPGLLATHAATRRNAPGRPRDSGRIKRLHQHRCEHLFQQHHVD